MASVGPYLQSHSKAAQRDTVSISYCCASPHQHSGVQERQLLSQVLQVSGPGGSAGSSAQGPHVEIVVPPAGLISGGSGKKALPAHPGCAQGPGLCDRRTQSPVLAGLVPAGRGRRLSPASLAWASVSISKASKSGGIFPRLHISKTSHPASGDAQEGSWL